MSYSGHLSEFELALRPSDNDIDPWFNSVLTSFTLIEPWSGAHSSSPEVQQIILGVKEQGTKYYEALEGSKLVAEAGFTFSNEASKLCGYLLEGHPVNELVEYIAEMQKIADDALKKAKDIGQQFRSVRVGLFQITQRIPLDTDTLEAQTRHALEEKDQVEKNLKSFLRKADTISAAAVSVVMIPAVLDVTDLFKEIGENHYKKKLVKRDERVLQCMDASQQLVKVGSDMEMLIKHVDSFADWWLSQASRLTSLQEQITQLDANQIRPLRIRSIRSDWNKVEDTFLSYVTKVSRLQDCYPSSQRAIEAEHLYSTSEAPKPKKGIRKLFSTWTVKGN